MLDVYTALDPLTASENVIVMFVSSAAVRAFSAGTNDDTVGAVVSTVIVSPVLALPSLCSSSSTFAVIVCAPSASEMSMLQFAVGLPVNVESVAPLIFVPPAYNCT